MVGEELELSDAIGLKWGRMSLIGLGGPVEGRLEGRLWLATLIGSGVVSFEVGE